MTTNTTTKIVVQRALDELSTISSRINDAVMSSAFISTVKGNRKKPTISRFKTEDELKRFLVGNKDKVDSLIKRQTMIKTKIAESNATTKFTVDGVEMTVAEALIRKLNAAEHRNYLNTMRKQLINAEREIQSNDRDVQVTIEQRIATRFGSDAKPDKNDQESITNEVRGDLELSLCDPNNIVRDIDNEIDKLNNFMGAVDSEMVICNSRTEIEI